MADSTYTPMAIWGRELRHYRKTAGLTQTEFAAKINYSPSLVSQIETGQVPATPEFAASCDETLGSDGALVRLLDPEAMREQLSHLVEMSSPKVQIQILPNGGHLATQGPFVLATLKNGSTATYLETAVRGLIATSLDDLVRSDAAWEAIKADALPVGMSKELIARTAEERWAP